MRNLKIHFYHPTIDVLSDRTFRSFLKEISRRLGRIQKSELLYVIESVEQLPAPRKQSLRDRVRRVTPGAERYYVESVGRNSLELVVLVSAAAFWIFNNTIGESVKEAWQRTATHKALVDYLSGDRRQGRVDNLLYREFYEGPIGRFVITDFQTHLDENDDLIVKVMLESQEEAVPSGFRAMDVPRVLELVRSMQQRLERDTRGSGEGG